jgi:hypothetical protein
MTRHSSYRSDKLSRLALSSEMSERDHPCGIRCLVEGRMPGAYFALMFGANLFLSPKLI